MINTYRYGGQGEVEKDGRKLTVSIPPQYVLNQMGAVIQVTITQPRIIRENLKQQGKIAPTISVNALIDTGASGTVITPRVADQLGLVHTGFQKVSSVQDEQQRPVYYGFIVFPWGSGKEIPIVSCPLKNFDCLIGRDILTHWHFTYNGPDGSIVICD
jgi:predicted aspartyl protease